MCKIEKSGRGRPGRGGGFGNSDTPGQGEGGWFENPRFWRTSFVDGPQVVTEYRLGSIHLYL